MRSAVIDLAAQPIRNRHPNPSGEVGIFGWGSNSAALYPVTVETDATLARTGTQCIKTTRQGTLSVTASSVFMTGLGGTTSSWAVNPGETISASVYVRPELAGRSSRLRFVLRDSSGATIGGGAQGTFTPVTDGAYNLLTISQIVPAGAASAAALVDTQTTDASLATLGERVWHDNVMLVNGPLPAYYADGSFPDWSWSGTPNASESVGYPLRMETVTSPRLSQWVLTGGAIYDPVLDEIVLPSPTAIATSPKMPTLGAARMSSSYEFFASDQAPPPALAGESGYLTESSYYAADQATFAFNTTPSPGPYSGNGNAGKYPTGVWTTKSIGWTLGPNIAYMTNRVRGSATYQVSYRFRNPTIRLVAV